MNRLLQNPVIAIVLLAVVVIVGLSFAHGAPNAQAQSPGGSAPAEATPLAVATPTCVSSPSLITVGPEPEGITLADNNDLYVANAPSNSVSVIDCATNMVIATPAVGTRPVQIAQDPASRLLYVTNLGSSFLFVIDPTTNATSTPITVGSGTAGIAIETATAGPSTIWVSHPGPSSK